MVVLKRRITEKDATILDLSANLADTKKRLDEVLADKDALMGAFEEERELLNSKIVRLNQLRRDLENKLKECRQKLAKDLEQEQKKTKDKLNEISEQLEISNDSKLQGLIDRINAVERRLNELLSYSPGLLNSDNDVSSEVG